MTLPAAIAILAIPAALAIAAGSIQLKRALARPAILPEELALAAAWVFLVASLFWLGVFLTDSIFLGFGAPWTWLAAAHFAFAGYGALTVTALSCRAMENPRALGVLRALLVFHPVAYLVTAGGILGYRYCDELGAMGYETIFVVQLAAVALGRPVRMARPPLVLLMVALAVPVATLVPAIAWAWGHPVFYLTEMVRYHGIVNATGHVGLGLLAFALGRPPPHSPSRNAAAPNR